MNLSRRSFLGTLLTGVVAFGSAGLLSDSLKTVSISAPPNISSHSAIDLQLKELYDDVDISQFLYHDSPFLRGFTKQDLEEIEHLTLPVYIGSRSEAP